ncbi:hypothetical protein CTI14_51920, partial [Methylobacterium radiotolerans]
SLVNAVLTTAPEFSEGSMVTTPMAGILDWTMGTPAGFAFYRDPRVNEGLKDILNAWCAFLDSEDSLYVLNDSDTGWKSTCTASSTMLVPGQRRADHGAGVQRGVDGHDPDGRHPRLDHGH